LKKDPNDELRFLMENPTRSDFLLLWRSCMCALLAVDWRARRRLLRK